VHAAAPIQDGAAASVSGAGQDALHCSTSGSSSGCRLFQHFVQGRLVKISVPALTAAPVGRASSVERLLRGCCCHVSCLVRIYMHRFLSVINPGCLWERLGPQEGLGSLTLPCLQA
jgi:hypothetical protein